MTALRAPWHGGQVLRRGLVVVLTAASLLVTSGCAGLKPTPQATTLPDPASPVTTRAITLVVNAPAALKPLLEKYLDLARLQPLAGSDALSGSELSRLIGAAPAQARDLLQTEGYFDAVVTVQRQGGAAADAAEVTAGPASAPAETSPGRVTVTVQVAPGEVTRVARLQVDTTGELSRRAAAGEPEALALQQALPGGGTLAPGKVFRNADWSATKQQLLAQLRAAGYASASLASSQADVDAPAHSAALRLVLDSGPLYLAGPIVVSGLQRHDERMVQDQAGFQPGQPLTERRLIDFQDRLQRARLFQSASVGFEPDPLTAAAAPVRVRLTELPLQQATVGLGVSANTGPRTTLEHTHRRPLDWPAILYNKVEWGQKSQVWAGDLQSHPGPGFYRNLLGVQIDREVSDTDVVLSQRLRLGRSQDTPSLERFYFAELLRSRQADLPAVVAAQAGNGVSTAAAISGNLHLVWRRLDSVLLPTRGVTLALQGGLGEARSDTGNGPFGRVYGRIVGYLPLGRQWYGQVRLEAGQIIKRDSITVPDALGFRAGGDDSVRGYAYRSLAPTDANGGTVSGSSLLTGSVELARPLSDALPSVWGAVFVDAGRAVNRWQDYKPALGYGAGIRWRSPIGPLRMDLAWADELKKLRLHLSVGIAF